LSAAQYVYNTVKWDAPSYDNVYVYSVIVVSVRDVSEFESECYRNPTVFFANPTDFQTFTSDLDFKLSYWKTFFS